MTKRSATRPAAAPAVAVRAVVALGVLAVLAVLLPPWPARALAAGSLQAVTVMQRQGEVDVVVQLDPAPLGPPASDAASATPIVGAPASPSASTDRLPATVKPVLNLNAGTPTAFVVDASASAAPTLAQTLSGAAGVMLKLPSGNPVTVVADRDPPAHLTADTATPADGIQALTAITASGKLATSAALGVALDHLLQQAPTAQPGQPSQSGQSGQSGRRAGVPLVLLTTSGPAPKGADADALVQQLRSAGVVLGVVGTGGAGTSWSDIATRTGGLAVAASQRDVSGAYDGLLAALQARYVVTFSAPPSVRQVMVTVTSGGSQLTGTVDLPVSGPAGGGATGTAGPSPGTATPSSAPTAGPQASSGAGAGGSRLWGLVAIFLVVAAIGAALAALRMRGRSPAEAPEPAPATPKDGGALFPGVRLFDVSDPLAPAEIAPTRADQPYPDQPYPDLPYHGRHRDSALEAVDSGDDDDLGEEDEDDDGDDDDDRADGEQPVPGAVDRQGDASDAAAEGTSPDDGDAEDARPVKEAG